MNIEARQNGSGCGVPELTSFRVRPDQAAVMLIARSSAGPITFGTVGIEGSIEAELVDGNIVTESAPKARLEIPVGQFSSGNQFYDGELLRRIDARRFPAAVVDLRRAVPVGRTGRYHVAGDLTFHGVTQPLEGTVQISFPTPGTMLVEGRQALDMRHFGITPPGVAMLKIYPDVRVELHLEATVEASVGA
jgi:polyisoprenoid-binding protein YceI